MKKTLSTKENRTETVVPVGVSSSIVLPTIWDVSCQFGFRPVRCAEKLSTCYGQLYTQ